MKFTKITLAIILVLSVASANSFAQTPAAQTAAPKAEQVKLYDPTLDGMKQIKEAVAKAKMPASMFLSSTAETGAAGALNLMLSVKLILLFQKSLQIITSL